MPTQPTGIAKIVGGIALMIGGLVGLICGRKATRRPLRIAVSLVSATAVALGAYLLVLGVDEVAVAAVGHTRLGGGGLVYASPKAFEAGLMQSIKPPAGKTQTVASNTRRLHFRCDDQSKSFTVYYTHSGIMGIPRRDVVCDDGVALLAYTAGD